jgi:hypothetical protein
MLRSNHRRAAVFVCLAALTLPTRFAIAQETDARWLAGLGIAPLSYELGSTDFPSTSQSATGWRIGPGGDAALLVGRGFGAWVVAVELSLRHTVQSVEQDIEVADDIELSPSTVTIESSATRVAIGPDVRYLFGEGGVRPFAELGAGLSLTSGDGAGSSDLTAFYGRLGPGVQLQLVPFASLDLLLRGQFSSGSGEYEPPSLFVDPGTGMPVSAQPVDIDVQAFEIGLHARLSVWL